MKKSTILFVPVTFLVIGIMEGAGKPVNKNGMPCEYRFQAAFQYNLNILGKQGRFICLLPEYADGTYVFGSVISVADRNGTATRSSDGIALNKRDIRI